MGFVEGTREVFDGAGTWHSDWAWGLLLIFLTVVIHIAGLGFMSRRAAQVFNDIRNRRHSSLAFVLVIGAVTMLATVLHVVEIIIWAASYRFLGALTDGRSAMLYSINAITSYGHESLSLDPRWQLLGAGEALNGWLLFGLTSAYLFSLFQKALQAAERQIQ